MKRTSAIERFQRWSMMWIALSLVRECRELEERYSSNFTTQILEAALAEHLDGAAMCS